jgi:hypothetical protein
MQLMIKIGMFEKLSKPLKMDGIQISLLDVVAQHCCCYGGGH